MFKKIYYLLVLFSISISSTLAMDSPLLPKPGQMTVKLKNQVPGLEMDKCDDITIKNKGATFPYVLLNPSDSTTYRYVTDIKVFLTMFDKNDNSSSMRASLPAEQGVLTCELPFEDRTQLDSISMQIQGRSFKAGVLEEDGKLRFIGDHMFVGLGSAWHSLEQNDKGWLYGDSLDSLYSYFMLDYAFKRHTDEAYAFKAVFGIEPWNFQ